MLAKETHLDTAFARVQAIPWDTLGLGPEDERLNELLHEFKHRVRLWVTHLEAKRGSIFISLAHLIKPNLDIPPHMDEWLGELYDSHRIPTFRGSSKVVSGTGAYLSWCKLLDSDEVPITALPNEVC